MNMSRPENDPNAVPPANLHFSIIENAADQPAWTEIEEGRFMPRRVRGSCQGRVLG
jgi:hypothetical protein